MTIQDTTTPVMIFPSPHHGGLGITRSLGRLGIRIFPVDPSRWCPSFFSRYSGSRWIHDSESATGDQTAQFLIEAARQTGTRPVLVPTTDAAARLVADQPALAEAFLIPPQRAALVHALLSKKEMMELARRHGVPLPATLFPRTRNELLAAPDQLRLPVIVKAIDGDALRPASKSKVLVRTLPEFLDLFEKISGAAPGGLMVQEFIPGREDTAWMFNGYFDRDSECLAGFTGRKLRQCPIYTGVASLAMCEENQTLQRLARRFLKALGYSGIVDIDFRYDARDGQYKILDINPRIGSTFRLFVSRNGLDVARAMYLDLTGQPVPESETPRGRKWIVEDLDLFASLHYARAGALTPRAWLKSLRGIEEVSFLAWDDPLPAAMMLRADAGELLGRRAGREELPPFEFKPKVEKQLCL